MLGRILTVAAVATGGVILTKTMQRRSRVGKLSAVKESIVIDVPISTAYNQWTQFEEFPRFMSAVHEVRQLSDTRLLWRATVAGKEKQWEAEIIEQTPDRRIAWRSIAGVANEGAVSFEEMADGRTRVTLEMTYMPESLTEEIGDTFGTVKLQIKDNLRKFKKLLESRGAETGAWRGSVVEH